VGVALGLLLSLAAATAFAQAEDAEAAIRQGMELRKQGQDARALPYLEKAYKLSRTSRTAAQLGLVQMGLGYWVDSEHHLDEALADPDNYWVAKNRPVLEGALTRVRSMIGSLVITGQPTGAEVMVNGRTVGRLPLGQEVRIAKGPAEIEVRADGYVPVTRTVVITGGGREQVSLALAPAPQAAEAALTAPASRPTSRAAGTGEAAAAATSPAQEAVAPADRGGRVLRGLAWGAAGVAVAALAYGGIETASMVSKKNDFNNRTVASPTADDPNHRLPECTTMNLTPACASLRSDYDSAKTLAIVGFVTAGALAAGSAVLFALTSAPPVERQAASSGRSHALARPEFLGCAAALTSRGIVCGARF